MEVHGIPVRVLRIRREDLSEAVDRARVPPDTKIIEADAVTGFAQSVLRLPPQLARLRHQLAVRVTIEEDLQLFDDVARGALIALRREHLLGVRHSETVL